MTKYPSSGNEEVRDEKMGYCLFADDVITNAIVIIQTNSNAQPKLAVVPTLCSSAM